MPLDPPRDPLYYPARRHLLFSNDSSIAHLQRRLRVGHQHAIALREALRGDAVEYRAETDSWQIHPQADRHTDFLLEEKLAQAARLIQHATALVIVAGAGMGIDSGLPDLQDNNGFWQAYPALGKQRRQLESIASPQALKQRPATAWGFYGHRLNLYRATTPHAGFGLLQRWGQRMPQGCFVFTNNVDGQFQKAGFPSARIYECHGSIHRLQCTAHCSGELWPTAGLRPQVDEAAVQLQSELPRCPRCGALARPNILMFDDWHWNQARSDRQRALLDRWLDKTPAPLVLEIGARCAIASLRHFTKRMQQRGSPLIRITLHEANIHNPDDIEITLGAKDTLEGIQLHLNG
ncbi:MAG: Sir2 family NAD-dependent protein deacetylase [Giesbergeria sp.]|nr:Sir2 family NAD-dependent protein deacetylase [Giesbergeria sp.]